MTARDCVISVGAVAAAIPARAKSRSCEIRVGHLVAATRPAWAALASSSRSLLQMLPGPRARWVNADGTPANEFFKLMAEVVRYLDNMRGQTIPQIVTNAAATQAQVTATGTLASASLSVANSAADAVNTAAQVVQDNGLSGAESIPRVFAYDRFSLE